MVLNKLGFSIIPSASSTDNEGTFDRVHNPRISGRSKHIHITYQTSLKLVSLLSSMCPVQVSTTKALPGPRFHQLKDAVLGTS